MNRERKYWVVEYDHKDGRKGTSNVTTEVADAGAFQYGNGKAGLLTTDGFKQGYDLRYCHGDLHKVMLDNYFGKGLVSAKENEHDSK